MSFDVASRTAHTKTIVVLDQCQALKLLTELMKYRGEVGDERLVLGKSIVCTIGILDNILFSGKKLA